MNSINFIELTKYQSAPSKKITINLNHLIYFEEYNGGGATATKICLSEGNLFVNETPEQIKSMLQYFADNPS